MTERLKTTALMAATLYAGRPRNLPADPYADDYTMDDAIREADDLLSKIERSWVYTTNQLYRAPADAPRTGEEKK